MNASALFWDIAPYVTIAILVVGTWWRYRYDKFGWTTRSSQLYESRLLRIGSPLFHFGILVVIVGHVIGLLIPESWTGALGLSEQGYHLQAVALGSIAGIATLGGAAILVYRRRTKGPVFIATTRNDKLMYAVLILAIIAGLATTLIGSGAVGDAYNYRDSVSVWFRSILILQPDGEAMTEAPACTRSTRSSAWRCSRCGRSPGWFMRSARPSDTCSGRISCTAPGIPRGPASRSGPGHAGGAGSDVQLLRMPQHPDDRSTQRRARRDREQQLRTGDRFPRPGPGGCQDGLQETR